MAPGEFKVHDLENLGDKEMVFMTIEFLNSANKPLALPEQVRSRRGLNGTLPIWIMQSGRAGDRRPLLLAATLPRYPPPRMH